MNEVEIPIKVSGLGAIKAELRDLKGQIADASDPAQMAALAQRAGELSDKLKDANEAAAIFSTGSKFEAVSNSFSGMKNDLANLDFEGAKEKANLFASSLKSINPAELKKSFGDLMGTIKTVGGAFVQLGITILANPIFLITAVIVGLIAVIALVLDHFGLLKGVLDVLMIPVNAVIQGFKDMSDFLGFTTYKLDEQAAASKKASAASVAGLQAEDKARQASLTKRKASFDAEQTGLDRSIQLLKIQGKDTTELERKRLKATISYNSNLQNETFALYEQFKAKNAVLLAEMRVIAVRDKDFTEYNKLVQEGNKIIQSNVQATKAKGDAVHALAVFEAQTLADQNKAQATSNKKSVESTKSTGKSKVDIAKEEAAQKLATERTLADQKISLMDNGILKEEAIITEKFKRQREDLILNEKVKATDKKTIQDNYDTLEKQELEAKRQAIKQLAIDNAKASEEGLIQLRLDAMSEGTEKEIAQQKQKYDKLRQAALADEKLSAEQLQEKLNIYNAQDIAETAKREKLKQDAANALFIEISTTDREKKVAELNTKYAEEQKLLANNHEALKILEQNHATAMGNIDKEYQNSKVTEAETSRQAVLSMANDTVKGLTDIGGMLIKDQAKLAKLNKASALIQLGIDTAKAISALVAAANSNPLNGVTAGGAGIAQYVAGAIQIATNMAKAKQILSNPAGASGVGGGGGGGGGGGSSAGSNTATVVPQGPNLFGSANTGNTMSAGGVTDSSMTVTAIVSETQVTSVQNKINRINKSAEL
jgi:hypothetical protein